MAGDMSKNVVFIIVSFYPTHTRISQVAQDIQRAVARQRKISQRATYELLRRHNIRRKKA